jgi:SOS-response transcriptional repressor LexA
VVVRRHREVDVGEFVAAEVPGGAVVIWITA